MLQAIGVVLLFASTALIVICSHRSAIARTTQHHILELMAEFSPQPGLSERECIMLYRGCNPTEVNRQITFLHGKGFLTVMGGNDTYTITEKGKRRIRDFIPVTMPI